MDYTEWSMEYNKQAQILKKYIKNLKKELKGKTPSEVKSINGRLTILYQMYLELKHISEHLKELDKEI